MPIRNIYQQVKELSPSAARRVPGIPCCTSGKNCRVGSVASGRSLALRQRGAPYRYTRMLNSLEIEGRPQDTRVVVAMSGGVDSW